MLREKCLIRRLKQEEGLRLDAYLDSDGVLKIGYGHRVKSEEFYYFISKTQVLRILKEDVIQVTTEVFLICDLSDVDFGSLGDGLKNALIDMRFHFGDYLVKEFAEMFKRIKDKDFVGASISMVNSAAKIKKFTGRALRNYEMIHDPVKVISEAGCKLEEEYKQFLIDRIREEAEARGESINYCELFVEDEMSSRYTRVSSIKYAGFAHISECSGSLDERSSSDSQLKEPISPLERTTKNSGILSATKGLMKEMRVDAGKDKGGVMKWPNKGSVSSTEEDFNPVDIRKPLGQKIVGGFLCAMSGQINAMNTSRAAASTTRANVMSTRAFGAGSKIGGTLGGMLAHADEMDATEIVKQTAKSLVIDAALSGLAPSVAYTASALGVISQSIGARSIVSGVEKAAGKAAPLIGHVVTGTFLAVNIAEISAADCLHPGEKWIRTGKSMLDLIIGMGTGIGGAIVSAKLGAAVGLAAGGPIGFTIGFTGSVLGSLVGGLASRLWNTPMRLWSNAVKNGKFLMDKLIDFTLEWDRIPKNTQSFVITMIESEGPIRWQVVNINRLKRTLNCRETDQVRVICSYKGVAYSAREIIFQIWALNDTMPEHCDALEFTLKHAISVSELKCKLELS